MKKKEEVKFSKLNKFLMILGSVRAGAVHVYRRNDVIMKSVLQTNGISLAEGRDGYVRVAVVDAISSLRRRNTGKN